MVEMVCQSVVASSDKSDALAFKPNPESVRSSILSTTVDQVKLEDSCHKVWTLLHKGSRRDSRYMRKKAQTTRLKENAIDNVYK